MEKRLAELLLRMSRAHTERVVHLKTPVSMAECVALTQISDDLRQLVVDDGWLRCDDGSLLKLEK